MTTVTDEVSIDLLRLVDAYVEHPGEEMIAEFGLSTPTLYRFNYKGKPWLTDRFWLLPESIVSELDEFTVDDLTPTKNVAACGNWLDAVMTKLLLPAESEFAATFAGVFTQAGLTAYSIGIPRYPHALVTDTGERVGAVMACREPAENTTPIPVSERMLKLYQRIHGWGVLRSWQAWDVAARLSESVV